MFLTAAYSYTSEKNVYLKHMRAHTHSALTDLIL